MKIKKALLPLESSVHSTVNISDNQKFLSSDVSDVRFSHSGYTVSMK